MSIFTKRLCAPNQLATLRELESRVCVGKVLYVKDSVAIISGLNADAPLGTKLAFVTGGTGVLLWHRSDDIAFALILGGAQEVAVGTGAECKIKGVLQVLDEAKGPITKKEFELFEAPVADDMFGRLLNFLGQDLDAALHDSSSSSSPQGAGAAPRPPPSPSPAQGADPSTSGRGGPAPGSSRMRPIINNQVAMKSRDQVSEPLLTGVKAVDLLTPLGRGACLLVVGPAGSGQQQLVEDCLLGQRGTGVRCVYASTQRPLPELSALRGRLASGGALEHCCIMAAAPQAPLGEKYAALCAALAVGERVRDRGGHCLVVLDDLQPLALLWSQLAIEGLGSLGLELARQGLVKDAAGNDVPLPPPTSEPELVSYQGMLVSGAVAQRRAFFSTLFMRPAKMARSLGGGSLTGLMMVPGRPATGVARKVDMAKYQTLSEEQKERMQAVLEARSALEAAHGGPQPGELDTETVEEFISIADGQLVLEGPSGSESDSEGEASGGRAAAYRANFRLSITRIGSRAFARALDSLAPQIRLGLAQADDARKFAMSCGGEGDLLTQREDVRNARMAAALLQPPGQPASLEELVVTLLAVQRGYTDQVSLRDVTKFLASALSHVQAAAPQALAEIRNTRMLTAAAEKDILDALIAFTGAQQ